MSEVADRHAAALWALAVLTDDGQLRAEVFRRYAGRGRAAWHALLTEAVEIVADTLPPAGLADELGMSGGGVDRETAAGQVRAELAYLAGRYPQLLDAADPDPAGAALAGMDDALGRLLDGAGDDPP